MNRRELERLVLDKTGTLDDDHMRLVNALFPALSAALHNSIMRGELDLGAESDTAFNYARVHRWIDAQFGPMPDPRQP